MRRATVLRRPFAAMLGLAFFCFTWGLRADDASLQDARHQWYGQQPNVLWILIEDWSTELQFAPVKAELLAEINRWRAEVHDAGVSEEFRQGGWPAKYPTKSLEEWQAELMEWEQALLVDGKASRDGGTKKAKKKP